MQRTAIKIPSVRLIVVPSVSKCFISKLKLLFHNPYYGRRSVRKYIVRFQSDSIVKHETIIASSFRWPKNNDCYKSNGTKNQSNQNTKYTKWDKNEKQIDVFPRPSASVINWFTVKCIPITPPFGWKSMWKSFLTKRLWKCLRHNYTTRHRLQ